MKIPTGLKGRIVEQRKLVAAALRRCEACAAESAELQGEQERLENELTRTKGKLRLTDAEAVARFDAKQARSDLIEQRLAALEECAETMREDLREALRPVKGLVRAALVPECEVLKKKIAGLLEPYFHDKGVGVSIACDTDAARAFHSFLADDPASPYADPVKAARVSLARLEAILVGKNPWQFVPNYTIKSRKICQK